MKKTTIVVMFAAILLNLALASAVDYVHLCLKNKESINLNTDTYSSRSTDGRLICEFGKCTAHLRSGSGFVSICVQRISANVYSPPGLPGRCSGGCVFVSEADEVNLTLSVNWPFTNGGYYTKQSFFMDISTSKIAKIELIDNVAGTQRVLCPNCNSYRKNYVFKQGFNDITIRVVKGFEILEESISFTIDNKKPVVKSTLPISNKFAASIFRVVYDEPNLKEIKLRYGNNKTGMRNAVLTGCESGKNRICEIDINLNDYDGQDITYQFNLTDLAGNSMLSKLTKIKVDETFPVISSFDYNVSTKYKNVLLKLNITESNFNKVEYIDNDDPRPVWKTVCSSLVNKQICSKKVYLKVGVHNIDVRVSDKAGNIVIRTIPGLEI